VSRRGKVLKLMEKDEQGIECIFFSLTYKPKARVTRHHLGHVAIPDDRHPEHDSPADCNQVRGFVQQVSVNVGHGVPHPRRDVLLHGPTISRGVGCQVSRQHVRERKRFARVLTFGDKNNAAFFAKK
jgi:hypothetical protein